MAGTYFYISSTETPPVSPHAKSGAQVIDRDLTCDAWEQMSVSQGGYFTLPFGHLPNTFCFISLSICFIFPSNLLHFPKKMRHFPNKMLHFPNKLLHLPNGSLHFPMQFCVTLPIYLNPILPSIFNFQMSQHLQAPTPWVSQCVSRSVSGGEKSNKCKHCKKCGKYLRIL